MEECGAVGEVFQREYQLIVSQKQLGALQQLFVDLGSFAASPGGRARCALLSPKVFEPMSR